MSLLTGSVEKRFYKKVIKTDRCWLWTGASDKHGYGSIGLGSRSDGSRGTELAHRVAWCLRFGEIPEGLCVLHRCDNPSCVRPDHLFLGTQLENIADMVSKKRHNLGQKNGRSRLTDVTVRAIKHLLITEDKSHGEIANMFGVCRSLITMIANQKRWRHVHGQ